MYLKTIKTIPFADCKVFRVDRYRSISVSAGVNCFVITDVETPFFNAAKMRSNQIFIKCYS